VSVWQQDDSANTPESLLTLYRGVVTLYRENRVLLTTITEAAAYDRWCGRAWLAQLGRFADGARGCGRTGTGGFNQSSQHFDSGGVDGQADGADDGVDGAFADEVARCAGT
jgi:hypothetical protein